MRYLIYILFSQIIFLKSFAQGNFEKYGVNVDIIAESKVSTSDGGVLLSYNSSTDNNYNFKILARTSRNNKGKSDQYAEMTWLRLKYVTNGNTYVIANELLLNFVPDGLNQSPYKEFSIEIPSTIQTDGQIVGEFYNRNGATIAEVKNVNTSLITKIVSGPSQICAEAVYLLGGPESASLENAAGVATLTSLGNNQWKVTNVSGGGSAKTVKLRSTSQGKTFDKDIIIGGGYVTAVQGPSSGHGGETFEFTMEYIGQGTIKWKCNSPLVDMSFGTTGPNLLIQTAELLRNQKNQEVIIEGIFTSTCGVVTQINKRLILNP